MGACGPRRWVNTWIGDAGPAGGGSQDDDASGWDGLHEMRADDDTSGRDGLHVMHDDVWRP